MSRGSIIGAIIAIVLVIGIVFSIVLSRPDIDWAKVIGDFLGRIWGNGY